MLLDSLAELARFIEVSSSAIYKAKKKGQIRLTKDGKVDTNDPVNRRYIMGASKKQRAQRGIYDDPLDHEEIDEETVSLEAEKLRAEIELKKKQGRKLDLQYEVEKKNLIHIELVGIWIGAFSTGIRNNFLQIGNRIARGDKKLRDRIEKEVKKAIQKTLDNAATQLRKESKKIIEMMEVEKN